MKQAIAREVARAEFVVEKIKEYDLKCSSTHVTLGTKRRNNRKQEKE